MLVPTSAGLGLEDRVPDHSTICRFRTLLTQRGLAQALFEEVARQLDAKRVTIRTGTLIDATAIEAAAAPPPKQKGGGRCTAQRSPEPSFGRGPHGSPYSVFAGNGRGRRVDRLGHRR